MYLSRALNAGPGRERAYICKYIHTYGKPVSAALCRALKAEECPNPFATSTFHTNP
jgi:hypothetical protein